MSGPFKDPEFCGSDKILDLWAIGIHVGRGQVSLQGRNRFPFFHDRDTVFVGVLNSNVRGRVDGGAVFDAAFFLKHFRNDRSKFIQKVFSVTWLTIDGGDDGNHVGLIL